jgi:hypothetical protein
MEISGHSVVEIAALIIEAVIMCNTFKRESASGVKLVPHKETADPSLPQDGKGAKEKHGHSPEPDGVFIGSYFGKILTNKWKVPQHPVEDPV